MYTVTPHELAVNKCTCMYTVAPLTFTVILHHALLCIGGHVVQYYAITSVGTCNWVLSFAVNMSWVHTMVHQVGFHSVSCMFLLIILPW